MFTVPTVTPHKTAEEDKHHTHISDCAQLKTKVFLEDIS